MAVSATDSAATPATCGSRSANSARLNRCTVTPFALPRSASASRPGSCAVDVATTSFPVRLTGTACCSQYRIISSPPALASRALREPGA